MSELPSILSYPKVLDFQNIPEIMGKFVYVIKNYENDGLAIMVKRSDDQVYLTIGDWDGNNIDLTKEHPLEPAVLEFMEKYSSQFVTMLSILKIPQVMAYFSVSDYEMKLVDLRLSLNKFCGPGMLHDLFGKIVPIQEVVKTETITDDVAKAIKKGKGSYKGDLILKCSAFKTVTRGKNLLPLYAKIIRQ